MSEPLTSWLADLRVRHAFLVIGRLGGGAGVRIPAEGAAAFHYCVDGPCLVEPDGRPPLELARGDFLFMRDGLPRVVWTGQPPRRRPVPLRTLIRDVHRDAAVTFSIGATASQRTVLGGAFCVDSPEARLFVAALPPVFCVRRGAPYTAQLDTIFDQLLGETTGNAPGAGPVVARLAEIAVLIGVRSFVSSDATGAPLLDAARHPRLRRVLAAIQRDPAQPWTIAQLGRVAGMSRSGFAAAFTAHIGEPPASYLARVRMARAERLLLEPDRSLSQIANAVGYSSVAAFSVAFKRVRGVPPGALRKPAPSQPTLPIG